MPSEPAPAVSSSSLPAPLPDAAPRPSGASACAPVVLGAVPARDAAERGDVLHARHRHTVRVRWWMGLVGVALGVLDLFVPWLAGTRDVWMAVMVGMLVANAAFDAALRRGWFRVRHFWAGALLDVLLVCALAGMVGPLGYLGLPFLVAIIVGQAVGLPEAARAQLAVALVAWPVARTFGLPADAPGRWGVLTLEVATLGAVGWLFTVAPAIHTHRLRRARHALAALERGDFSVRLPTRALDDLGQLAHSFNHMAAALGQALDALRDSREAYAHMAHHDPLTGLGNRALLADRLARALGGPAAERTVLLLVDLDGFKHVNDTLGHDAGDRVLCEVARRLLNATRGSDTVVRLGGDEFAVLLERVPSDREATVVAERIVTALQWPIAVEGQGEARIGGSVGVARARAADALAPGDDRAALLVRDADAAMYHAKAGGKGRHALYAPGMTPSGRSPAGAAATVVASVGAAGGRQVAAA